MKRLTNAKTWELASENLVNEMGYSYIWKRLDEIEDILSDENGEYDLDRLVERYINCITLRDEVAERFKITKNIPEIAEAEKHKNLKVVPCKEGDVLYFYSDVLNEICKAKIIKVEFNFYLPKHTIWISFEYDSKQIGRQVCNGRYDLLINKELFITKQEAEQALKEHEYGRSD